ncbi:MAG: oligosaccharide flippase family protein [Planctomycetia bacterium]|nr:oligosaccharide flippase family protein [Planctomycetia bacterium]
MTELHDNSRSTQSTAAVGDALQLSRRSVGGVAWMVFQTLASKGFGVVGQIILASLLLPHDFGLVGLAYAAGSIPNILRKSGMPQILVQKQRTFNRWSTAAFWMEIVLGLSAGLLMLLAAPFAAMVFHAPQLIPVMEIIAPGVAITALFTVPTALLMKDMRFRELAVIGLLYNLTAMALSIMLAAAGWGVYSFVIPLPVVGALRAVALWIVAPAHVGFKPHFHRWPSLFGASGLLMGSVVFLTISRIAEMSCLRAFAPITVVGDYFFASNLSTQVTQVFSTNVAGVLYPALTRIQNETQRQSRAFLRAANLVALVGMPLCVLESLMAGPALTLVYGDKWRPAILPLELLALGAAFMLLMEPALNLLLAQGRFVFQLVWASVSALIFIPLAFFAAWFGGAVLLAAMVATYWIIMSPLLVRLAISRGGGTWRDVTSLFLVPAAMTAVAALPWLAARILADNRAIPVWENMISGSLSFILIYTALVVWFRSGVLVDFWKSIRR